MNQKVKSKLGMGDGLWMFSQEGKDKFENKNTGVIARNKA
jgi:hypothetical protein